MHIAVDVREACGEAPTGKGRWTLGFVTELLQRPGNRVTLLTDTELPEAWKGADAVAFPPGLSWHIRAGNWAKKEWPLYFSPTSFIVPAFGLSRLKTVPVVHDLIAFTDEPHDRRARVIERWTLPRALKHAAAVLTVSETTSNELLHRFPVLRSDHVTTVYAGPTSDPLPRAEDPVPTIVCVGTLCPRKNQLRLIRAFASLPPMLRGDARLIIAGGRGWEDDAIVEAAQKTAGVEWKGYMPDSEWRPLLASASVLAFPSLHEGFGLPIVDAFRQGVPVLTSDRGSMKEVAGDAALLVDPNDTDNITKGLAVLLTDQKTRAECIERGHARANLFTWKRAVDAALPAFERATAS